MTLPVGGVPEDRSDEQRRVIYCPLNQIAIPQKFEGFDM